MTVHENDFLSLYGWDSFFESHRLRLGDATVFPARVVSEERGLYRVQRALDQSLWAAIEGKKQHGAASRLDYPAVGDWVLVEQARASDRGTIRTVLPRKTLLQRKAAGENADLQILATNVDHVFISTSINEDLNPRRIERYLAIAFESGCRPILLLTKADLRQQDLSSIMSELKKNFPDLAVHALSRATFNEATFFAEYLKTGTTSVFLGSSGVGKSTLANFLIGADTIKTQDIREDDSKGRHTTTSRNLYRSRFGGLIIDTPGMRELQLSTHTDGIRAQFADVEALLGTCRFSNCQHRTEPGCAIKSAIAKAQLTEERWQSYQKLETEVRQALHKQDKAVAAADRRSWKKRADESRERGLLKKRGR